jgi:hypothetical protein
MKQAPIVKLHWICFILSFWLHFLFKLLSWISESLWFFHTHGPYCGGWAAVDISTSPHGIQPCVYCTVAIAFYPAVKMLFSLPVKTLSTSVYNVQKCRDVKTWDTCSRGLDKQTVISIGNKITWVCLQRFLSLRSFTFTMHNIQTWLLNESVSEKTLENLTVNWKFG